MEKKNKKGNKSFGHNTFQKIYLLSNFVEETKVQKDWFMSKFDKYISTIKHDVDKISRDEKYERLSKKINIDLLSQHKTIRRKTIYPEIKNYKYMYQNSRGNKYSLKKSRQSHDKIYNIFGINNDLTKNNSSINLDNQYEPKNKTINVNSSMDTNLKENSKITNTSNNISKISRLDLSTLPNIPPIEPTKKYLTKYINTISDETDMLEKKLIKQEKMRYIGFKSKYNRLYNNYKKVQVDINQYVDPKKDKRYKFNLSLTNEVENNEKLSNLRKLMRQISNKIRNKHKNKPTMSDIIKEVENFKFKEKRLRERTQKNHDKFNYLIHDSNVIQKRIDLKCQKNELENF